MVMEFAGMEQSESLDVERVGSLVDQAEGTADEVRPLAMEIDSHGAKEGQLKVSVTVETITVGDAHTEVAIDAHVLDLGDELFAVTLDDVVESDEVAGYHFEVSARHDIAVFKLIDGLLRLRENAARRR